MIRGGPRNGYWPGKEDGRLLPQTITHPNDDALSLGWATRVVSGRRLAGGLAGALYEQVGRSDAVAVDVGQGGDDRRQGGGVFGEAAGAAGEAVDEVVAGSSDVEGVVVAADGAGDGSGRGAVGGGGQLERGEGSGSGRVLRDHALRRGGGGVGDEGEGGVGGGDDVVDRVDRSRERERVSGGAGEGYRATAGLLVGLDVGEGGDAGGGAVGGEDVGAVVGGGEHGGVDSGDGAEVGIEGVGGGLVEAGAVDDGGGAVGMHIDRRTGEVGSGGADVAEHFGGGFGSEYFPSADSNQRGHPDLHSENDSGCRSFYSGGALDDGFDEQLYDHAI